MAYKTGKKARKAMLLLVVNLFFVLLCFLVLIPVLYAFSVSLNADNSLLSSDFSFLPKHMTLANYRAVCVEEPILRWFSDVYKRQPLNPAVRRNRHSCFIHHRHGCNPQIHPRLPHSRHQPR